MNRQERECCDVACFNPGVVARLQSAAPSDESVDAIASIFAVLADPTRIRVLAALGTGGEELCVCDIANIIGLTISATSHQLRKLREAGVVTFRNDGRLAFYRLADGFTAGLLAQARVQVAGQRKSLSDTSKVAQV